MIPVRGRKPILPNLLRNRKDMIPIRGRKLLSQVAKPNNDKCDPRKGTKNSASEKMRNFSFVQP